MPDPRVEDTVRQVGEAMARAARAFELGVRVFEQGRIESVHGGVVRIAELPGARIGELLEVGRSGSALVLGLGPDGVEAVAVDDRGLLEGAAVRAGGRVAALPVSEALLSRVVDPLGRPRDGAALEVGHEQMPFERTAPAIHQRSDVHIPLLTGTLAVDAMVPIARGQRELVLGDEGTGKTALALDAMLRQKNTGVVCVYVAIGRRRAEIWRLAEVLRREGGRWAMVAAADDESPAMRYLAPYAGTALGEYFTRRGEHALVVYDDLSAHAVAWRELSLLLRRPPGREAYPGDVFYLHARLLERSAQLSAEQGGGSLTALPIATLEAGRLTGYIPTNLISITDGQIVLSHELFAAGQKPAIDMGLSVSRVGAKAQPQVIRDLAARLKLDYASFLELETFARLGTRLEPATERRLAIGRRIRRLLRAKRMHPLSLFDETVRLALAASHEQLLAVPEERIGALAEELTARAHVELAALAAHVEQDGVLPQAGRERLAALTERVVSRPARSQGPLAPSAEAADAG